MTEKNLCYYTLGGINYKNGFVTSCPQQSDQLHIIDNTQIILPSEIINSKNFKEHRKEMMLGKWSTGCHLCKEVEEANSGKSMRQDYPADKSFYNYDTGTVDFKSLKHVELRFSNACNMACLHCSEVYSSGWQSKLKFYKADKEDWDNHLDQLTRVMHRSNPNDDLSIGISLEEMTKIVKDLNSNFPNIEKIDFAGGEVLYQKQFMPCLELLGKHPNASNIHISFHTNFNTKFDPVKLSQLLDVFGRVTIMISLDSGTNIYPYFRTGNWDVLKENLNRFKQANNSKKIDLNVVCTTSAYQIMDIENVFESFLTLDIDWINSSIVYTPKYINPAIMMFNFKDHVMADIQKTYELIERVKVERLANFEVSSKMRTWRKGKQIWADIESATSSLKNIETYITNHVPDYKHYEAFLVYIRKTDMIWKHNFNDYFKNYKYIDNKIQRIEA